MPWSDFENFINQYQTLIAGLIAILAAYLTARPVWRQLDGMSVQTNTLFRDYVLEQLRRTDNRRSWYSKRLGKFVEDTCRRIYEMEEMKGGTIDIHWAHGTQQDVTSLLSALKKHGETRDLSAIERELSEVFATLSKLADTLDSIHRPHSMDKHDPEHPFTDEQWAALGMAGKEAEANLASVANDLLEASNRLDAALVRELTMFRQQLKQVQAALLKVKV